MAAALVGAAFLVTGTLHFVFPGAYESIVPEWLPAPRLLVYLSGVAELIGGACCFAARTRRFAGVWLIALLVAVFPANVFMAVHADRFSVAPLLLWLRLPLQAVFVAVVWWALLARRHQPE